MVEKVNNGDSKTIAQFLDRYDCGAAVPTTDDVVYSRLRHAADTA